MARKKTKTTKVLDLKIACTWLVCLLVFCFFSLFRLLITSNYRIKTKNKLTNSIGETKKCASNVTLNLDKSIEEEECRLSSTLFTMSMRLFCPEKSSMSLFNYHPKVNDFEKQHSSSKCTLSLTSEPQSHTIETFFIDWLLMERTDRERENPIRHSIIQTIHYRLAAPRWSLTGEDIDQDHKDNDDDLKQSIFTRTSGFKVSSLCVCLTCWRKTKMDRYETFLEADSLTSTLLSHSSGSMSQHSMATIIIHFGQEKKVILFVCFSIGQVATLFHLFFAVCILTKTMSIFFVFLLRAPFPSPFGNDNGRGNGWPVIFEQQRQQLTLKKENIRRSFEKREVALRQPNVNDCFWKIGRSRSVMSMATPWHLKVSKPNRERATKKNQHFIVFVPRSSGKMWQDQ